MAQKMRQPLLPHSPTRRRTLSRRWCMPKIPRPAKALFSGIILASAFFGILRGVCDLEDLKKKHKPIDFSGMINGNTTFWPPEEPFREPRGRDIDDRYLHVRDLGRGREGSAAVYTDTRKGQLVVVKTYNQEGLLNPIPWQLHSEYGSLMDTWPVEIEASMLLNEQPDSSSWVPMLDYFTLGDLRHDFLFNFHWAMVTPFISGGTLETLAASDRKRYATTPEQLDHMHRQTFLRMVDGIKLLHEKGMCHDDIKGDNIFVHHDSWLIGDMGNMRQLSHAWHSTRSWVRQNQLRDCQVNDLKRALKTYMGVVLRGGAVDQRTFDKDFWTEEQPWARLYWNFVRDISDKDRNTRVPELSDRDMHDDSDYNSRKQMASLSQNALSVMTERELTCITIPKRLRKWSWWFEWV